MFTPRHSPVVVIHHENVMKVVGGVENSISLMFKILKLREIFPLLLLSRIIVVMIKQNSSLCMSTMCLLLFLLLLMLLLACNVFVSLAHPMSLQYSHEIDDILLVLNQEMKKK